MAVCWLLSHPDSWKWGYYSKTDTLIWRLYIILFWVSIFVLTDVFSFIMREPQPVEGSLWHMLMLARRLRYCQIMAHKNWNGLEVHASIFCRSVFRASFVDKCLDTSSVMAVSVVKMLFGFQIQVTWLIFSFPISNQVTLQNEGWPDSMRGHLLLRRELVQCFKPNSGNCFQISRDSKARPWQHSAQADWCH